MQDIQEASEQTEILSKLSKENDKTHSSNTFSATALTLGSGLLLEACGGGAATGSNTTASSTSTAPTTPANPPPPSAPITDAQASRFLSQASVGATRAQMAQVQASGYSAWIDAQIAMPQTNSRWSWLKTKGFDAAANIFTQNGFDSVAWYKLINSPDTLRQRVTHALAEIMVVGIDGLTGADWQAFAAANYLDVLEANAFGNYRQLLQAISTNSAMGQYLTFAGNLKANPAKGTLPDENYARELMQLFSIGLLNLNQDGTPITVNGVNQETYTLDDITGLARIFTGWDFDVSTSDKTTPDFLQRPLTQIASRHETGASTFLGSTVPAGLDGPQSMSAALDIIFAHPNVAPFVSRQLIQRLVTSNPSPAYVQRIAAVFSNDGTGVKGNLAVVVKAILLDDEARNSSNLSNPQFGKLREPIYRFLSWARAYSVTSPSDLWNVGNTSDAASRLGQSPLRSSSVFNFFRPGYVPPNTSIANASLVAPEFQITNESTVIGYVNFMQRMISKGNSDLVPDYSSLLPIASNPTALLTEINSVVAAGQLSDATIATLASAVSSMPGGTGTATDAPTLNRIYAALTLVFAATEYIVQK